MIESSQLRSVANDIQALRLAYTTYVSNYGALPGDDKSASSKFGNVENGDGDNKISSNDAQKIFKHLYSAGLIESASFKLPKIGGNYSIISENSIPKIMISNQGEPSFTRKQAISLRAKLSEMFSGNELGFETDPTELADNDSQKYSVKIRLD